MVPDAVLAPQQGQEHQLLQRMTVISSRPNSWLQPKCNHVIHACQDALNSSDQQGVIRKLLTVSCNKKTRVM
jgi:hypothetical protein